MIHLGFGTMQSEPGGQCIKNQFGKVWVCVFV